MQFPSTAAGGCQAAKMARRLEPTGSPIELIKLAVPPFYCCWAPGLEQDDQAVAATSFRRATMNGLLGTCARVTSFLKGRPARFL